MQWRSVLEYLIPYVGWLRFSQVPVKGLVNYTDVHDLLYGAGDTLCLPSTIVKHSKSTGCPVAWLCWWIGDGAPRCSLCMSPNVLPDSPMCSSGKFMQRHLNQYITQLSDMFSLSLGPCIKCKWCYCLWSVLVCLNYCRSSWTFHWVLLCKVLPWKYFCCWN